MNQKFYQVGGSLPSDILSYIKREADAQLYNYLKDGKYCYVLNARQVGKSSLRIRASKSLEAEGYTCVNIDVTSIGSDISAEQWYYSLADTIIEQLGLPEDNFGEWWEENTKLTVVRRFAKAFDKFILNESLEKIVIFIDEVDSILGVTNFSTDDFFAVIRTFYNLRGEDPKYNQISFALFGVATPEDLMRDSSRTPFNIAHSVTLNPFKLEESLSLINGLKNQTIDTKEILERVFFYTSGMPYLTQKILEYISLNPIKSIEDIEKVIGKLFIREGLSEKNLRNVQKRILNNTKYNIKMINIVARILQGENIKADDSDLRHIYLKLSGLVKKKKGQLEYSNKIYERVFNKEWLEELFHKINRPFAQDLNRWLELKKDTSTLLKGEVLINAKKWAIDREDLTPIEHQYLNASIQEEHSNYAKEEIDKEKKKSNKKLILRLSIALFITLIFAGGATYFYFKAEEKTALAIKAKEESDKQARVIKNQNIIIEEQKEEAENKTDELKKVNKLMKILSSPEVLDHENNTEEVYLMALANYRELIDNNITKFKPELARILNKLGDVYQTKEVKKAEEFYTEAIKTYTYKDQKEKAIIYWKLSSLFLEKENFEISKMYHDLGFNIYRELLKKNSYNYLPQLAKRFCWLGKWHKKQNNQKKSKKNYIKSLAIFKKLNSDNPKLYLQELKRINKNNLIEKKKYKQGWVYIGKFIDKEWEEQSFGFRNTYPKNLKNNIQIAIEDINVRIRPAPKAKTIKALKIGGIAKILKIKTQHFKDSSKKEELIWAFIKY